MDEIELIAMRYAGVDYRQRRNVLVEAAEWDDDFSMPVADFIAELQSAMVDDIPAAYREACVIGFERGGGYDESHGTLRICYTRPESDDEVNARIDRAHEYAREQMTIERAQFERLKAKFGQHD